MQNTSTELYHYGVKDMGSVKVAKLDKKADNIKTNSEQYRAKLRKNRVMAQAFRTEISKIDQTLVDKGKRYLEGK